MQLCSQEINRLIKIQTKTQEGQGKEERYGGQGESLGWA